MGEQNTTGQRRDLRWAARYAIVVTLEDYYRRDFQESPRNRPMIGPAITQLRRDYAGGSVLTAASIREAYPTLVERTVWNWWNAYCEHGPEGLIDSRGARPNVG